MRAAVVGHLEWVDFVRVERTPETGEIVHALDWWAEPGGGGPGAAVQLARLTGDATLYTALGDDELGHRARAALTGLGVRVEAVFRPEPTRRAITHIDGGGERTITVLGARLAPFERDPLPWDELERTDAVYFTAGDLGALRHARRARVLVATARVMPLLAEAHAGLDALVGSATDPSEGYAPGDLDPPPLLVVRTAGAAGGTFALGAGPEQPYRAAPVPGPVVDTYGCGDAFAAGLAYALATGTAPADAVAFAARCGAAVLAGRGPYDGQLRSARD